MPPKLQTPQPSAVSLQHSRKADIAIAGFVVCFFFLSPPVCEKQAVELEESFAKLGLSEKRKAPAQQPVSALWCERSRLCPADLSSKQPQWVFIWVFGVMERLGDSHPAPRRDITLGIGTMLVTPC